MHFDAAFASLRTGGRIAVCGAISNYNLKMPVLNAINITAMIYSFQRIEGFMCGPWLSGARGHFHTEMRKWFAEGKIEVEETVFHGIERWSDAFQSLFTGANSGKVVLMV
jgi:NADPH-dependent curcumin reductase CurA